jgi:hypothetical protein
MSLSRTADRSARSRRRGRCPGSIERAARLLSGEPVERVLAEQSLLDDRPWYPITTRYFDTPTMLTFLTW